MRRREALDETFDSTQTAHYDLMLTPCEQGVSIVLHDAIRNIFLATISFPWTVIDETDWSSVFSELFQNYPWLKSQFRTVRIGWNAPNFTLAPREYFVPVEAKHLLQSLYPMPTLDAIYANIIDTCKVVVFGVPSELLNAVRAVWSEFTVLHTATGIAKLAQKNFRKGGNILLLLDSNVSTLCLMKGEEILAVLPFTPSSASDVLYRVVDLCEAYGLSPADVACAVCGLGQMVGSPDNPASVCLCPGEVEELLQHYMPLVDQRLNVAESTYSYLLMKERDAYLGTYALMECE